MQIRFRLQLQTVSQSQKKVGYFYFYDNLDKSEPIFIIVSLLHSERVCGGRWNQSYHLPSNLLPRCIYGFISPKYVSSVNG